MPGVWNPISGATSAAAMGAIRIDTSDLERAGAVTKVTAQKMTEAFKEVDKAAKKPKSAFVALASDIQKVRGEVAGLSAAAGVLSGIGLSVASNMQAAAIQFTGLTGGIKQANVLMADLRKKGLAAGIPFNDMLKAAKQLLPTLEGNTQALDTYARLARRVAVLNPAEGISGAAFAINEALASGGTDLVSLSERFQVSRFKLREAMKETNGDFAAALDMVLNKMGITQQVADDMGNSFQASFARAKDSAGQLLGAGFTPILNALPPILDQATQFMVTLQETNPELLTMASGAIALTAAVGPLVLILGQVVSTLQTIKGLSIAGTLGKAGAIGLAAAGGVGLGVEATRGIGRATGNEQLANTGAGDLWKIVKTYVLVVFDVLSKAQVEIGMFIGSTVRSVIGQFVTIIGEAALAISEMIAKIFPRKGAEDIKGAQRLIEWGKEVQLTQEQLAELRASFEKTRNETAQGLLKMLFPELSAGSVSETAGGGAGGVPSTAEEFTAEQIDAFAEFQQDMKDLEKQGAEDRLRINERYQEAVASIEERLADLRKSIAKAEQETAESEAKAEEDFQLRRQQTIEDAQEDSIRAAEDFNRQKERDEREHRNNLMDAASRFDALGIIREMRAYNEKRTQANEDFTASQKQRSEELQQRLEQEAEAHDREMDELRGNNRQRLNELRQQYAEEYRAAQDKLLRLRDTHIRELSELDQKLAREREIRQRAYIEQFNSLAGSLNNQITIARQGQAQIQADLRVWWTNMRNEMNAILNAQGAPIVGTTPPKNGGWGGGPPEDFFASGGPIPRDMIAGVHAGEEIITADVARQLRSVMGGSINQPALVAAAAGGMGGGMSIGSISVGPIIAGPGQSVQDIAEAVRNELLNIIEKYNKS